MAGTLRRAALLATCLIFGPALLGAQARPMSARPAPPAVREEVRNWYAELQRISVRLQQAHARAHQQDEELRRMQASLTRTVKEAMDRADPGLASLARRVQAMEAEARAAQESGDAARLQALQRELAQIQARFINVESAVLRQPAIAEQARAYEGRLRATLLEVEPETERLLERSTELQHLLQRALGAAPRARN